MKFVNQNLFSLVSLGLLVGISQSGIAMDAEESQVKRDQYFRQAKAKTVNYADVSESPVKDKKRARQDENYALNLSPSDVTKNNPSRSVSNTRGFYLETGIPRLNLPNYRVTEYASDFYYVLESNMAYQKKARKFAKKPVGK